MSLSESVAMRTSRLEAFSDGVLAIIITIMVLELKIPHGDTLSSLREAAGTGLLTYLLSFIYIGIYWNNHHHMFQLTERISGGVLWANLHLLFWLSLYPFSTAWMDESDFARTPVVVYGVNLLGAAIAYYLLQSMIVRAEGPDSPLRRAIGSDVKGKLSPVLYIAGIGCALFIDDGSGVGALLALAFFVAVAVMWLVPDRRLERFMVEREMEGP